MDMDLDTLLNIADLVGGGNFDFDSLINGVILEAVSGLLWGMLLLMLPVFVVGILYCFFGLKMHRGLVVMDAALTSGNLAALLLIILVAASGGSVTGMIFGSIVLFIVAAVGFGILAYKFPKVFICIHSFGVGFFQVTWLMMMMTSLPLISVIVGLLIGVLLAILTALPQFTKPMIMGTHAFKGGVFIAMYIALLILAMVPGALQGALVTMWIALIGFAVGGFLLQYSSDKKRPVILFTKQPVVVYNYGPNGQPAQPVYGQQGGYAPQNGGYQQAPVQQQVPPQQQANNPIANMAAAKLIGVEGAYKGASFDLSGVVLVGRDATKCNIVYPSGTKGVSRIQCQFTRNPQTGAVSVQDNGSSYGTSVNGAKLQTGQIMYLNAGDVISFGENNVFKIEY